MPFDKNLTQARGFVLKGLLVTIVFCLLGFLVLTYIFGYVVPPGYVGVRQISVQIPLGLKQGFSDKALLPGYHWSIPFYSRIHKLPSALQLFNFSRNSSDEDSENPGILEIQTRDGSSVNADVTIVYRFYDAAGEEHGGPAQLLTEVGSKDDALDRIKTVSENELKESLGKLSTSEFYNPFSREKQIEVALNDMNDRLELLGIKVEQILLRRYTYAEERIDRAIFEKNLQNQEERLNAASSKLSDARSKLKGVSAEWDAKIETLKVEGQNKALITRSEARLYEAKKNAEAELLVAKARAESDRLKSEVLKEPGAQVYVARGMTPLLESLKGGVVSGLDPYDMKAWMKRFGVSQGDNNGK